MTERSIVGWVVIPNEANGNILSIETTEDIADLVNQYFANGKVKITITPIEEEPEKDCDEPTINLKLSRVVRSDEACSYLGLNPWCVNEGANGDDEIKMPLNKAIEFGLVLTK